MKVEVIQWDHGGYGVRMRRWPYLWDYAYAGDNQHKWFGRAHGQKYGKCKTAGEAGAVKRHWQLFLKAGYQVIDCEAHRPTK